MNPDEHDPLSHVFFGTSGDDTMTHRPGDVVFGLQGDDTIAIEPVIGGGPVTGEDRAFVFAGVGDDTVTIASVKESPFPVTAFGGAGDDTFVFPAIGGATETSFLTGGSGQDLFEFSLQPFHGADNITITDFSRQDAVRLDLDPANVANFTFEDHGSFTALKATTATGATVELQLAGNFDESQFEVTNDGQNHAFITYGQGAEGFLS
jgi:hypothetical protein